MAALRSRLEIVELRELSPASGSLGSWRGAAIAASSDPGADYNDLLAAKSQPRSGSGTARGRI